MSVFGSTIKESLSTTTLSDATLTNSLKEVTVRRIPVNEGQYNRGVASNSADPDFDQLQKDVQDAEIELVRCREDEDDSRLELQETVEMAVIWKELSQRVQLDGEGSLNDAETNIYRADSKESLDKLVSDKRIRKTTKTNLRVTAQKGLDYAREQLRKYTAKPGKNRFVAEGEDFYVETTHAVDLPQPKQESLETLGIQFRAFFSKENIRKLDSEDMLKFLRKYRKAIPTSHPNFAAFSFVMDDIAEDMDMSRVALLNMLRPLMAQETQGQVNRLLNNMQFSGDMDLYEMKLSAHRNRRVLQMKKDKKLPHQLKAQEDWDRYTWGQRFSKTRSRGGKRNGDQNRQDQNRQGQKSGKGKRSGMNSRRGKNNNPSGNRSTRGQNGGRQNNRRQNRQNGGNNSNPQGQQNGGTLRRNFSNNNTPSQAEG